MSDFKEFQKLIFKIYGEYKTKDLYFSQLKDGYSAAYKPRFPEWCDDDEIIQYFPNYERGAYELIHKHAGKYHSHYSDDIDDLAEERLNRKERTE